MKKVLEKFQSENLDKSMLFNTMADKIFGGDTSSNGYSTKSTGSDCDDAHGDSDADDAY